MSRMLEVIADDVRSLAQGPLSYVGTGLVRGAATPWALTSGIRWLRQDLNGPWHPIEDVDRYAMRGGIQGGIGIAAGAGLLAASMYDLRVAGALAATNLADYLVHVYRRANENGTADSEEPSDPTQNR
jgi:hypothetical protein